MRRQEELDTCAQLYYGGHCTVTTPMFDQSPLERLNGWRRMESKFIPVRLLHKESLNCVPVLMKHNVSLDTYLGY